MPLQEQIIPIQFGQGLETKTDPKAVQAGKFLRLENGVFTAPGRIAKRNGYTALGTSTAPVMTHEYNGELLKADSGALSSWSPTQSAWFSRGAYFSTELTRSSIDNVRPSNGFVDCTVLGNYALYGWGTAYQSVSTYPLVYPSVVGSVVDLQTGAVVSGPTVLSTSGGFVQAQPKCVLIGGTQLAVFYENSASTAIVCRLITIGVGTVSFGSELTVTTNYSNSTFDAVATSTGAAIVYGSTTGVTVATINTSGAIVASANTIDAAAATLVAHVSVTSNGNIWAYWIDTDATPTFCTLVYKVYSSALGAVLAKTSIAVIPTPFFLTNIIAVNTSATQQTLYYSQYLAASNKFIDLAKTVTVTSAGVVGAPATFAYGVCPFSRVFTVAGNNYLVFVSRGASLSGAYATPNTATQPTYFVVALSAGTTIPLVVARFAAGLANNFAVLDTVVSWAPSVASISSTKFLFGCGVVTQDYLNEAQLTLDAALGQLSGAFAYTIDFNGANSYRAVNSGQLAVLNGGALQVYDGQAVSEFGFHQFPEIVNAASTTKTGGAVTAGTHSLLAIFQWTDAQGNLHQSTPSASFNVTMGGADTIIRATVTTAYLSQKSGVCVAVYCTIAGGSIYYLATDPVYLTSADPTAAGSVVVDILQSDAQLALNPQSYTSPISSVLENTVPPPSMAMVSHGNRLWFVDSEHPNDRWYTKSFSPGTGLSPSGFLVEQTDPKLGTIVALAEMDEKLVIGKQYGIFVETGDGANDTGQGSTLSGPQQVPSDVGVSALKSVVTTPMGIIFKSPNGLYLLDRSLSVKYVGADVEAYNAQTVTDARLVPGKSQARFLCSSGLTLVFDYIYNQWSTFTAHTGVSATVWNSTYVYSTGTAVLQEAAGTYADNGAAFALLAQTSWLALASVQGFQRVKRLIMLGDFTNGLSAAHKLSISAAYDFSTTFQTAVTYTFGIASASGVFQYRERLPIQKCDAVSLLIQETTTGSALEYVDLTSISFEAAVKKGANKLGGAYSVG